MKQIAIIGSTASGKTGLSLDIANKTNSVILSLDSLSVYKEINIASAKPTKNERGDILHFGIDEVYPNEEFDVIKFLECYEKTKDFAMKYDKNIIIVGGTGFYLKALVDGLSPGIDLKVKLNKNEIEDTYNFLYSIDKTYMEKIEKNDKYRIEKAISIYKQTNQTPTQFFEENEKKPLCPDLKIFEILWDKEELRKRVALRTNIMMNDGIIDEVIYLENKYTRKPNCMVSIGIVETLQYLDSKIDKKELEEKIVLNTMKLAKRQNTFNKGQFSNTQKTSDIIDNLNSEILKYFSL